MKRPDGGSTLLIIEQPKSERKIFPLRLSGKNITPL